MKQSPADRHYGCCCGFGYLQNQDGLAGLLSLDLGKDEAHLRPAPPLQSLKAAFVTAFQFFINQHTGGASVAFLHRQVDTLPGQSEDLTDPHRAVQSQEQGQTEEWAITEIYRPLCLIGSSDSAGHLFILREGSQIDLYVSPGNRLIESAAQESMDFFNHLNGGRVGSVLGRRYWRGFSGPLGRCPEDPGGRGGGGLRLFAQHGEGQYR